MSGNPNLPDGPLPVHESVNVMKYKTLYKTKKWWKVAALVNMFGHDRMVVYQWIWDDKKGGWKRKQKMSVLSPQEWEEIKSAGDELVPQIRVVRNG